MKQIKVLLSDFQYLTRAGLSHLIQEDPELELIGTLEKTDDLLKMMTQDQPDVLIMDYQIQEPSFLNLLKELMETQQTNVLIITNDHRKEQIQALLNLGIKGIVTKNCSRPEIIGAIHSIAKNNRFYCNKILDMLMDQEEKEDLNCDPTSLTSREYEVIRLITKGFKTAEIADQLFLSVHTINSHRKNILKKLNLKSPTELIVYAIETGLVNI